MSNFFGNLLAEKDTTNVDEKERAKELENDIRSRIDISFKAITDNHNDRINFSQTHLLISQGIGIGIDLSNLTKCCEMVIQEDLKLHSREWQGVGIGGKSSNLNKKDSSGRSDPEKNIKNVELYGEVKTNGDSTNADVAASSVGGPFDVAYATGNLDQNKPGEEYLNTFGKDVTAESQLRILTHSKEVLSNTTGSNLIGIQSDEKLFTLAQVNRVVKRLLADANATSTASFNSGLIVPLTLLFPLVVLMAICKNKKSQNLIDNIFATWSLPKRAWEGLIKGPTLMLISTTFWGLAFWNGVSLFQLDSMSYDPG